MTDYCAVCGDADSENDEGKYVEVSNGKYDIYTQVWVCMECLNNA